MADPVYDATLNQFRRAEIDAPIPVVVALVDGAIVVPNSNTLIKITKASAIAATLAAPTAAQEGVELTVIAQTGFIHVITATGLLDDGVTGGSKNTATFAAFPGAAITLRALNLKWAVVALKAVTVP